ncbi:uncharacterized protein BHQ10_009348 [Talaromyces amestolkiae]|uniref:Uncharacterized protein n=1 Tax=Talaromyces amestolkiae TaxID=1196081 RepID=A0A364LBZ5_TALAM|nr:uncharacterized protein BHQ10_009348 [Talaromyces amestolkiae]RAO73336.1 hypothetical protein BHQ10_009348 [Talaromyces amestolkiae]
MGLASLPSELILYLSNYLSDDSLNGLIRTRKSFAHLLTPILYEQIFASGKKHLRPQVDLPDLDPYNLPLSWHHCVSRWESDLLLGYIRSKPAEFLMSIDGTSQTLLHVVARSENILIANILVHEKCLKINSEAPHVGVPLFQAIRNEKVAMFKWLICNGADITRLDPRGRTVLEETALFSSGVMVRFVLDTLKEQGHEVTSNTLDKALHCSLYSGRELAVRTLLDHGADPSSVDGYGTTALEAAAVHGHENIVHILLDSGANPLPLDTFGRSALTCAADGKCSWETTRRILDAVLKAGGDIKQVHILSSFASQVCVPAVKELLSYGVDVLSPNESGVTALHMALYRYSENLTSKDREHYEQVCKILIKATNSAVQDGGEFDHNLPRIEPLRGGTSLHLAAKCDSETVMRMLIESGVDTNILDLDGKSALDIAILAGHKSIARLLESRPVG